MKSKLFVLSILLGSTALSGCYANDEELKERHIMDDALIVDFPVRNVCITPNTPGSKVPSHGTEKYGETYAIDFVVIDEALKSRKPYRSGVLRYVLSGVPLKDFYGWGVGVYSPVEGEVVKVIDGIAERDPASPMNDVANMIKVTRGFEKGLLDSRHITGNCVYIRCGDATYALLAHLQKGSVSVKEGDTVHRGQLVGRLGHSGNSTMPHLHMQFMDSMDFDRAQGIPFKFREYETYRAGKWARVFNSLPTKRDLVRVD